MQIDRKGEMSGPLFLGNPGNPGNLENLGVPGVSLRLNRQDRLLRLGDRIYLIATGGDGDRSRLYFVRDDS